MTEEIVQQHIWNTVSAIAIDSINDYLYWSNDSIIVRSNLDGSEITPILDFRSNGSVKNLVVDSEKG